ncbi:glutathionylspermidine synthase family protein [Paenibacillus sp. NEAU-GSW1]|uniref:glutathionylspermidine synthase family protein n=1 Tax=Paenibacillus sp. NEAU-GSW1 TaxID=2682486 RepID=UPI0012E24B25|nr:glutathionylspermidine synthase family protein [Paenibacillus sp. NEAU-GSW1]MUT68704.1 glutathionylspermidine synthase [Paenibacillus sp. NEAU-GSW1]
MTNTGKAFEVVGEPRANREQLVEQLAEMGFTWANLEGESYWIDQAIAMSPELYEKLEQASAQLWRIFDKTCRFAHRRHDLYGMLGIPELLWQTLDTIEMNEPNAISRYARFDFAISNEGDIRLLELNSDTPTGYVESAMVTPWQCERLSLDSPNARMKEQLAAAWAQERPDTAACVAYGEHLEDTGTIDMLVKHSGLDIDCVDCLDLWVDEGILRKGEGERVERMFALYPKEWMAVDDGGEALAYAVESGQLTLFNSVHALIMQSKGMLAFIWGLYELQLLYSEEERAAIESYMLPTYNKAMFSGSYVSKSMFGREGGSVKMYDDAGRLEVKDEDGFDTSRLFPRVYQKRAELAKVELAAGEFSLLTGMFVINGVPCGMLGRAGGLITGNTSHFVAIGVKRK